MGNPRGWGENESICEGGRERERCWGRGKLSTYGETVQKKSFSSWSGYPTIHLWTHNGRKSKCFGSGKLWKLESNKTKHDHRRRTHTKRKNVVKLNCYHCCVTLSVYNRSELRPRLARQLHHWLNHRLCQDYSRSRHSLYTLGPFEMRNDLTRALLYKTTWKCMRNEWLLTRCSQTHGHSVSVFVCCAVPAQL